MKLDETKYGRIIYYLLQNTDYSREYLLSIKDDDQLFSMYQNIKECMERYPKEILEFYKKNLFYQPRHTSEEVYKMTYNELSSLRDKLGLRKRGKKVKSSVPAGQLTIEDALREIEQQTPTETATNIIISNSEDKERDEQILTPDEIKTMYGEEEYSFSELQERGIVSTEPTPTLRRTTKDSDERYEKIDELICSKISIDGEEVDLKTLVSLEDEEFDILLKIARKVIKEKTNNQRLKP